MSAFKAKSKNEFPLRQSLFWMDGRKVESTWGFFARNHDDAWRWRYVAWLNAHRMNTMIFLMFNRDPNCRVSFFQRGYATEMDLAQALKLEWWLDFAKRAGANLVPTMFCDGDPDKNRFGWDRHERYFSQALPFLSKYCRAILIGLESTEYFSTADMERLITLAKKYTTLPIGTHMQWDRKTPLPRGLDWLGYEHSWPPDQGDRKSVAEVVAEGREAIARSKLPVAMTEYNYNPAGQRIREQSRALATLPGCVMLGGPL